MMSFEDFAVLERKQKPFSLCIKLLTYKCKSFVCTKLETMNYQKRRGKKTVQELLLFWEGEQLKVEYKHRLFTGVITALKLLLGFKWNLNTSQVSASVRYNRLLDWWHNEYLAEAWGTKVNQTNSPLSVFRFSWNLHLFVKLLQVCWCLSKVYNTHS